MVEHEVALIASALFTKMELLKGTVMLLLMLVMLAMTHGGGKGGTKHVHFKIHVPEFIKHHHHTKTVYIHVGGHGGGHGHHGHGHGHHGHGHGHVHIHHHGHGHGNHHDHGHGHHHGHGHGHHHDHGHGHHHDHGHGHHGHGHGHHHGHEGHHTHEFHYIDLHHGHGGHHSHKVHENHHNRGKMWDGHEGHQEQEHMQIANGQKQQGGHAHGGNENEMYNAVHPLGGGHYTFREGEGQGDRQQHADLDSLKKVVHWNQKGHGHSVESGDELGTTHGEVHGHGHMTHSTDHILSLGIGGLNGDVHAHPLSGHHKGGVENDYNHLEYAEVRVPCADYGGAMNAGLCKGDIRGGHTQLGHGFGQVSSGKYGGELGGDHSHKDYGLGHVLNEDYEKVAGVGQSYMDIMNDHVSIDYGGKTGSLQNYGHAHVSSGDYRGNLGGGPNHMRHADAYDSRGGFEGQIMITQGHKNNVYKVNENVMENQPSGHHNYGLNDNMSTNLRYVEYTYIDPNTATDLGPQSVGLKDGHELDAIKHQHLQEDGSVVRNSYGDAARDSWYKSHNSMGQDHSSFEHSFGNNHVD